MIMRIPFAWRVGHSEFAFTLPPCGDFVGAGAVREEFQNHIILVVSDTLAQGTAVSHCQYGSVAAVSLA